MKLVKVIKHPSMEIIVGKVTVAETFWQRLKGLMFASPLDASEGLLIEPCSSIHMMFMRFPIDAIFLDASNKVKKLYSKLSPWIGIGISSGACKVIELQEGVINKAGLKVGDLLILENI